MANASDHWCDLVKHFFNNSNWTSLSEKTTWHLRAALLIERFRSLLRSGGKSGISLLKRDTAALIEDAKGLTPNDSPLISFLKCTLEDIRLLERFAAIQGATWCDELIPQPIEGIPSMVSADDKKYFKWLASTYVGKGEVVELGCWFGAVTCCLAAGLQQNPAAAMKKVHACDAFVWHEWMCQHDFRGAMSVDEVTPGGSFEHLFRKYCHSFLDKIHVSTGALCNESGAFGDVSDFTWSGKPIGLLVNDCWDDAEVSEAIWAKFSPFFIPGETQIVLCQFGNLRAEQLRRFCRDRLDKLIPVHRLPGAVATFRYAG